MLSIKKSMKFLSNLTIGKRIFLGFASIMLLVLVLGIVVYNNSVNVSKQVSTSLTNMRDAVESNLVAEVRIYAMFAGHAQLIDGYTIFLQAEVDKTSMENAKIASETQYAAEEKEFTAYYDEALTYLKKLNENVTDVQIKDLLTQQDVDLKKFVGIHDAYVIALRGDDDEGIAKNAEQFDATFLTIKERAVKIMELLNKELDANEATLQASLKFGENLIIVISLLVLILGVVLLYFIIKSVNAKLNESISQMIDSANQLAATSQQNSAAAQQMSSISQQVAAGATEQSKQSGDVGKAISSMASSVQQMSAAAQEAASTAEKSSNMAQEAGQSGEKSRASLETIKSIVANTAVMTKGVSGKSKKIGDIVETITGIAKQTNLLALNANIEAARAGDAGRGFAVVADEVRKLAEGSSNAADQIKALVSDMITSIDETTRAAEEGTRTVEESSEVINATIGALQNISASVMQVSAKIQELSAGIQQQAASTQQIAKSMDSIASISEQNSAGAQQLSATTQQQSSANQQVAAAAQQLQALSNDLMSLVKAVSEVNHESLKKLAVKKTVKKKTVMREVEVDDDEDEDEA